ncbi:MAG: cytochrome c [Acidobacteriaceae bacterium]
MRYGILLFCAALLGAALPGPAPQRIPLAAQRTSPQDLEISGDVPGIPQGEKRFVHYAALSGLAQVTFTVRDDANFSGPVKLSGVPLDALTAALGVGGGKMIAASSNDGYEAHYTPEYRATHHPFLVLRMGGEEPAKWAKGPEGENYGPYLISHASFSPAFHVLAQKDEAQIPYGVMGLRFLDEAAVLKELRPPGAPAGSPAMQGYRIVLQNCLRCHREGDVGGTKSPFGWPQMALIAEGNPSAFGKYVVRPNSVNPEANMPANPDYDAATVTALTDYFRSFAPEEKK